jgi:outer membrane protein assembly factor BamB
LAVDKVLPGIAALLAAVLLTVWVAGTEVEGVTRREPSEAPSTTDAVAAKPIAETHELTTGGGTPSALTGSWPRFRGEQFDNIAHSTPPLARSWPDEGPPVLWSVELGEGHAGPAVLNGRVYLLDYDEARRRDTLRCFSLDDGAEIWRSSYPADVRRQYGMSRTVPAVTDQFVVTLGPQAHVMCVDAQTGAFRWAIDLPAQFQAKVPPWYAGQCPMIDDGKAIIAVGGSALMIAVDCQTGDILWQTPNPNQWQMTHSSIVPMEFDGVRMYLYAASGGIVGVSADDGRILWQSTEWRVPFANVPCPIPLSDGRIFLAGGYGAGSMMMKLSSQGDGLKSEILYRLKQDIFSAEQHTPIYYRDHFYGMAVNGKMVCLAPSGKPMWNSGTETFGRGPYLIADGMIFVMNDFGVLTLLEASPVGYNQLARAKVLQERDSWGPMALVDGRLLVRDPKTMVCLDVRKEPL